MRPTRTPNGVEPTHRAFECNNECDNGQVDRAQSPMDEVMLRCPECKGEGVYSYVGCSECNDLLKPEDVRSEDNSYVYCEQCTTKLLGMPVHPIVQSVLDSICQKEKQ